MKIIIISILAIVISLAAIVINLSKMPSRTVKRGQQEHGIDTRADTPQPRLDIKGQQPEGGG